AAGCSAPRGHLFRRTPPAGPSSLRRRCRRLGDRVGRGAGATAAVPGRGPGLGVRHHPDLLRARLRRRPGLAAPDHRVLHRHDPGSPAGRPRRPAAGVAAVAGFAIFPWLDYLLRNKPAPSVAALTALAAWLLVVLGAGEAMRIRRERAAAAARIREEEARRRASEERLRMARELHD